MQPLDYLVIAPHPDDAELGVGGTIPLLQAQGARVGVLDLTDGEPTPFGSPEIRRRETEAATAVLGLAWRGNLGLTNRRLEATSKPVPAWPAFCASNGRASSSLPTGTTPIPITSPPAPSSMRPASGPSSRPICRASRTIPNRSFIISVFISASIHGRRSFSTSRPHIETKMQAVAAIARSSSRAGPTPPTLLDDLKDRARYWGWAIGAGYGEPFVTREEVGLRGLRDLP